jgi:hypothetical protein
MSSGRRVGESGNRPMVDKDMITGKEARAPRYKPDTGTRAW